ncbi:MAG: hypothetical protein OXB97_11170 [Rhodospirillales bacterium]|nr:hypothetical protein [Rhodospirillales bacterium]
MSRRPNVHNAAGDSWRRLLSICQRASDAGDMFESDHEWRFVEQMRERLLAWREESFLSFKQLQWLNRIDERLDREGLGPDKEEDEDGLKPVDEFMAERTGERMRPDGSYFRGGN